MLVNIFIVITMPFLSRAHTLLKLLHLMIFHIVIIVHCKEISHLILLIKQRISSFPFFINFTSIYCHFDKFKIILINNLLSL